MMTRIIPATSKFCTLVPTTVINLDSSSKADPS